MNRRITATAFLGLLGSMAGCASPNDDWSAAVDQYEREVSSRLGAAKRLTSVDAATRSVVEMLLADPLTDSSATTIALLQNRTIRAALAEVGVTQADLLEAGLIKDPVIAASVRFPNRSPSGANTEFSLTQPLMELLLMPLRLEVARGERESAVLRAAQETVDIATQAVEATHELRAATAAAAEWKIELTAAEAAAELAEAQKQSGATSDLLAERRRAELLESRIEHARATASLAAVRERLIRVLGIDASQASSLRLTADAPVTSTGELSVSDAEGLALERRLDVAIARREIGMIDRALELTKAGVWTGVHIGVDTERDTDGARLTGPTIEWEAPIFNRRKGEIARLEAQRLVAVERLAALELRAKSEARETLAAWQSARVIRAGAAELTAARGRIVARTLEHYNRMTTGAYDLLASRRDEAGARRQEAFTAAELGIALARLERAIGGKLPASSDAPATQPATQPEPPTKLSPGADPHAHHHHH